MHRFYLPPGECKSDALRLTDREAHHALHVLRLKSGEQITVLNGAGLELLCTVERCDKKQVELKVVQRNSVPPLPFQITLLQAIPKGKIIEGVIQKATELGATRIVPLLTERVATRLDNDGAEHKGEKWQQVAIESIKQCGSAWLPKVEAPVTPVDFLARKESFDLPLIASLQPGSRHPREYFRTFEITQNRRPESVCIWVGPEGDFTPSEVAMIQTNGAQPITLGRLVLRVETAATYCLSVLNYELLAPRD